MCRNIHMCIFYIESPNMCCLHPRLPGEVEIILKTTKAAGSTFWEKNNIHSGMPFLSIMSNFRKGRFGVLSLGVLSPSSVKVELRYNPMPLAGQMITQ